MTKKLNVGVVGLGRLGNLYARYFLGQISNANLVAVSDILETVAASFANDHNVAKSYRDYHDLVQDKDVDAVVIVTPTSLHKEVALAAIEAGKPVFCEKPLSISMEEIGRAHV